MSSPERQPRVLIVADHASAEFGGEAILPLHTFRFLRKRGVEAWMVCHARTRPELERLLGADLGRVRFVPDTWLHRLLWRAGSLLPDRLNLLTTGYASHLLSQVLGRRLARALVREHRIDVVHQPIPVSPKEPSLLGRLGAPVIIGPMNGGMRYPPAFRQLEGPIEHLATGLARASAWLMNALIRGKRRAHTLLVANERTRAALPSGLTRHVALLVENGVDLTLFAERAAPPPGAAPLFVFLGRLIPLKAVDVLLEAFAALDPALGARLEIVGDGPHRAELERRAAALELGQRVRFRGWLPQQQAAARLTEATALVLPSVRECGGAVVLEAMAVGLPVIATDWGGPADYLDESCGLLVAPDSRAGLRDGFAAAMERLARDPELCRNLGRAGRRRVEAEFDWERKLDRLLEFYREAAASTPD